MRVKEEALEEIVHVCLRKTGIMRNFKSILLMIEEYYWEHDASKLLNYPDEEYEDEPEGEDWFHLQYAGAFLSTDFRFIDKSKRNSFGVDFTDKEFEWMEAIGTYDIFMLSDIRREGSQHEWKFFWTLPEVPNKKDTRTFEIMAILTNVNYFTESFDVSVFIEDRPSKDLKDIALLYALL